MTGLKLWISVLALTSFASGIPAGIVIAQRMNPRATRPGPFQDYEALLNQKFELSPERRYALNQVMGLYARDVEAVRQRYLARAGSAMQKELEDVGLRYAERIRNDVLPADQRAVFDELARATPYDSKR
jgi:hypothetical protein